MPDAFLIMVDINLSFYYLNHFLVLFLVLTVIDTIIINYYKSWQK